MPFIEIITDAKSQIQLSKIIDKEIVNDCDIMYIKEKNIENIKNIKLETIILNQPIENIELINKILLNTKNIILNFDFNEEKITLLNIKNNIDNQKTIQKTTQFDEKNKCQNTKLISFGYSSKSDITVSSVAEDEVLIYIQNTINSIYGRKIEPQEIKVNVKSDTNIYNIMIIIALTALYAR